MTSDWVVYVVVHATERLAASWVKSDICPVRYSVQREDRLIRVVTSPVNMTEAYVLLEPRNIILLY